MNRCAWLYAYRYIKKVDPWSIEIMHFLPKDRKLVLLWERAGINIENFTDKMYAGYHRLKEFKGVHTNWPWGTKGANWNAEWLAWFADLKSSGRFSKLSQPQLEALIRQQLEFMMNKYGFYMDANGVWCINRP